MITTKQQRNQALKQLAVLRDRLGQPAVPGVPTHIVTMGKSQLRDRITDLESELAEYDQACSADVTNLAFDTYTAMLKIPIIVRLATRHSIPAFAKKIGISESQLKRYEAAEYTNAPASIVDTVLNVFGLHINGRATRSG